MKTSGCAWVVASFVCLLGSTASAAVGVGDKPTFDVQDLKGARLSLEQYRGKIVIVDFWATWCGPCMAEADHMVRLHNEFGPKGVQLIGISLDQDKSKLKQVVQSAGFAWPQFFDGQGWGNRLAVEWGVQSIPATFILDPEGTVVWKGHPAQIDGALASAMQKTPPSAIDPAIAKEADAKLSEIEGLLQDAPERALNLLGAVPNQAIKVDELKKRIQNCQVALLATAKAVVASAETLIAENKFEEAATKLQSVASAMSSADIAKVATGKLQAIQSNPEYLKQKQAVEEAKAQAKRREESQAMLKRAQSLAGEKRHEEAYAAYRAISRDFAGTPAAEAAAVEIAAYEKDAAFMRKMKDRQAKELAEPMLSLARNYARTNIDTAKRKYNEVISSFPGTTYAETAKKEMAELDAKAKKK